MSKILIIGGNRFVGKEIAKKLYDTGHEVTVLNRSGTKPFSECNVIRMNRKDLTKKLVSQEIIIDMCAYNTNQVKSLLKSLKGHKLKQYIIISSIASEYPFFGEYGKNKAEIETFLRFETNIPWVILRPTYIIGKNDPHKRLDYFLDCIKNGKSIVVDKLGSEKISFVFVEDVAQVIYKVISRKIINKTYNVCNDDQVSIVEFIDLIFKIIGKKTGIRHTRKDGAIFIQEVNLIFQKKILMEF